jgi:hypothetical protein
MRISHVAFALALFGVLAPVAAPAAINIHFEVVNDRGENVTVEGAGCANFGKTTLAAGKSIGVTCPINVGGQAALQVRTIGGVGVICWPHAVAIAEYRIEAGTLGTSSCSFQNMGGTSYRYVLTGAKYFTIHMKNERKSAIMVTLTNSNCTGYVGWNESPLGAGASKDFRCFREDFASGQGITIQARVNNNTRDLICQGWWHENKTSVFSGSCPINRDGEDYFFIIS